MRKPVKIRKQKLVHFHFIKPESEIGQPIYRLLRELVSKHHEDLSEAYIALAWNTNWRPDVDGRVTLGKCQKVNDLHREVWGDVAAYDFIIILRKEFWTDLLVTDLQRRALLDHELCHAGVKLDDRGERVTDEHGRIVYRMVRHTIEDFTEVVGRYGCYKSDLTAFAQALDHARHLTADRWIGYRALQQDLAAAGVSIPIEAIREWTDTERREASTWALLRQQFPGRSVSPLPALLARAAEAKEIGA